MIVAALPYFVDEISKKKEKISHVTFYKLTKFHCLVDLIS